MMMSISVQDSFRSVGQYSKDLLRIGDDGVQVPVTYKKVWDDGYRRIPGGNRRLIECQPIPNDAIEMEHGRSLAASADGYPVAFGDPGDVRLMKALEFAEPEVAVDTDEDKSRFEAVGMRPVVNRSIARGIDIAAAVLRSQRVDEEKIQSWMQRQQERALQAAADLDDRRAVSVTP